MLPDAALPVPSSLMNLLVPAGEPVSAAIPVLAKLVVKSTNSKSRLWLAARMAHMIADAFPGRETGVVADSAYAGAALKKLPARVAWTTRLRKDAALCELPPRRTGIQTAMITCLWYSPTAGTPPTATTPPT